MKIKGVLLACSAGALWALSGIMCQILFEQYFVSPEWLASVRLLMAGIVLTVFSFFKRSPKKQTIHLKDGISLLLFSLIGMLGVQYTYFKAIQYSGAAIATILQFTGPIFIFIYLVLNKEKRINLIEIFLMLMTFVGVFFIVAEGNIQTLNISPMGFAMGMASAVTLAFYTVQPRKLLIKYGEIRICGLGMLIGGILFQPIQPFWQIDFHVEGLSMLLIASIIIFGTALPFLFQLSSLRFIEASLAGILTVVEPVLATILSVLLFHSRFGITQTFGFLLVIGSVILLTRFSNKKKDLSEIEI